MAIDPGPYDLDQVRFIVGPDGGGTAKTVGPSFYQELASEFEDFRGHCLIQRYTFSEPWPSWEVHPAGDEFVYLIAGDTDFVLRAGGEDHRLRVDRPGSYVVVPRGTWHTARPNAPTTMLFVTPGEGTLNAAEPPP